jgi:hypothetical protein
MAPPSQKLEPPTIPGRFTLIYPDAGFDPAGEHFGVILDGQEVGTIYRLDYEWLWSINLGMMGAGSGEPVYHSASKDPKWAQCLRAGEGSRVDQNRGSFAKWWIAAALFCYDFCVWRDVNRLRLADGM